MNEKSVDSKNNDESKINDYEVYSDDAIDGIGNLGSGNEKDEGTTATPRILTSILDKLPNSDVLSNSLSPSSSSSPPPSSSTSKMGEVIPGQ